MRNIFALLALLIASSFAHCAEGAKAPKCDYNGSTQESNACVYDELDAADREMNNVYKSKLSLLPAPTRDILRREQREWLKSRDPQCKEDAKEMEGLSGWVSEFYGCITSATKARTQQLKAWKAQ